MSERVKYTHRTERLIHIELERYKIKVKCSCQRSHREWFRASEADIKDIIRNWITYMNDTYGRETDCN